MLTYHQKGTLAFVRGTAQYINSKLEFENYIFKISQGPTSWFRRHLDLEPIYCDTHSYDFHPIYAVKITLDEAWLYYYLVPQTLFHIPQINEYTDNLTSIFIYMVCIYSEWNRKHRMSYLNFIKVFLSWIYHSQICVKLNQPPEPFSTQRPFLSIGIFNMKVR